jgi:RimJ/RimL family protein N-acetyltransferase
MSGDPSPQILLRTERMYLRRFRLEDDRILHELDSDPEVMRFISKGQPTSMERIQTDIMPRLLQYYTLSPPQGCWAAHLLENGEFIGWFHLRQDKITPEDMELGYRLKRVVWGRGLATEGSRALVERAFLEWNYPTVSARTVVANLGSRRVMEKAGLRFESEFLWSVGALPGWTDDERRGVKYELTRLEFVEKRSLQG